MPTPKVSTIRENTISDPIIFRNNWLLVAAAVLCSSIAVLAAPCILAIAFAARLPMRGIGFDKVIVLSSWVACAIVSGGSGLRMWRWALAMSYNQARLDGRGLHFRWGPKKSPQKQFLAWDQIAAIKEKRVGTTEHYFVIDKNGRILEFTLYSFFHPKELACRIAVYCGKNIEDERFTTLTRGCSRPR